MGPSACPAPESSHPSAASALVCDRAEDDFGGKFMSGVSLPLSLCDSDCVFDMLVIKPRDSSAAPLSMQFIILNELEK